MRSSFPQRVATIRRRSKAVAYTRLGHDAIFVSLSLGESSHNSHAIKCCRMHTTRTRTVSGRRHDSLSFSEIDNDSSILPVGLNRPTRRACSACIEWQCWDRMAIFLILLSTVQLRWIVVTVFDVSACRLRDTQIHIVDTIGKVQLQSFPFCWS